MMNAYISPVKYSRGCYYISSSGATTVVSGTPIKIVGTTTPGACIRGFTHTDNRLTRTGTINWFHFQAYISMTSNTNNITFSFYIAKNGTIIAPSKINRKVGTGGDVGALTIQANIELDAGDYVEVFVDADGNNDFTAEQMTTHIMEMGN